MLQQLPCVRDNNILNREHLKKQLLSKEHLKG